MITVTVTSESSMPELKTASRMISELITLRANQLSDDNFEGVAERAIEISKEFPFTEPTFNSTELAEAEALGKPAHSTADASQSTTAHADMTVNTSMPAPTSVFGQPAQTTENVANPVAPTTESPVRDADGLVWDKRIHSSSKELNKDGTWRRRRGVEPEYIRQVEAELRGAVKVTISDEAATYVHQTPTTDMTFPELLDAVTKAMVAGQVNQARIAEALGTIGLTALPNLLGNPQLIPAFREALGGVV